MTVVCLSVCPSVRLSVNALPYKPRTEELKFGVKDENDTVDPATPFRGRNTRGGNFGAEQLVRFIEMTLMSKLDICFD